MQLAAGQIEQHRQQRENRHLSSGDRVHPAAYDQMDNGEEPHVKRFIHILSVMGSHPFPDNCHLRGAVVGCRI